MAAKLTTWIAGVVFGTFLVGALVFMAFSGVNEHEEAHKGEGRVYEWWQHEVIYHLLIPSFRDSNYDGFGDIKGVMDSLDYLEELGISGDTGSIWLSPFYKSGGRDLGYDVINHTEVAQEIGTQEDLNELLLELESRGTRVILEFIPNHTSNESDWFVKSVARDPCCEDFYVWRDASGFNESTGQPIPPNNWESSVEGWSAWSWSEERGQFYLHNFFDFVPDLNLRNDTVRKEIKDILHYWLDMPAVYGVHIGSFNLLIEDVENDKRSDAEATMEFFHELKNISKNHEDRDGIVRLFLLDMVEEPFLGDIPWTDTYRNATLGDAVVPFTFGDLPWNDPEQITGHLVFQRIKDYLDELPDDYDTEEEEMWPCWETNDHDLSQRIPVEYSQLVIMLSMLLPGTNVVYYGNEIGLDSVNISCSDSKDPYALPPYAECEDYPKVSRDPGRTPMQWTNGTNAGFSNTTGPLWLPIHDHYIETMEYVEAQETAEYSFLKNFRQLVTLERQKKSFNLGRVFFPYHDREVFTFMSKFEDEPKALMVVINWSAENVTVDITTVTPDFPETGKIEASTLRTERQGEGGGTIFGEPFHLVEEVVHLDSLELREHEGMVISIDFEAEA